MYIFAAKFLFQLGIVLRSSWYDNSVDNIIANSSLLHGEITNSFWRVGVDVDLILVYLLVEKYFW